MAEGAPLDLPDTSARRYLPYALTATFAVVVLPAVVLLPLAPLDGLSDVVLSAVLAIGLSVAAGSVGAALWARRPDSRDIVFGDLMLWRWLRRMRAERHLADATRLLSDGGRPVALTEGDPLLPALQRLSDQVEMRDSFTRGHSRRVARHAERIATQMGLTPEEIGRIRSAALLHDLGNLLVPQSVLAQPGRLTDEERMLVQRHAVQGAELVAELGDPELTAIVRHHHERADGQGYPDGLAGDTIPLGARIIAVADSFDALTSPRPHRGAVSQRSALDVISEEAGRQFDPVVVSAFLDYYSGKRQIAGAAFVATAPQRVVSWIAATPAGVGAGAPAVAQGVCAAGAVAIAGVCIGGAPALTGGERDQGPAQAQIATRDAGGTAGGAQGATGVDPADDGRQRSEGKGTGDRDGGGRDGGRAPAGGESPTGDSPTGGGEGPSGGSAPGGTGGGGSSSRDGVQVPDPSDVVPGVETPDVPGLLPQGVSEPVQGVVDPIVDTVDQVLAPAPAPVGNLTKPVKKLLGDLGLGSPAP